MRSSFYLNGREVKATRLHFPSVSALDAGIMEIGQPTNHRSWRSVEKNAEIQDGYRIMREGDISLVDQAQTLIDRFNEEIPSLRRSWQPSVAGFFPNVPAFLNGEPESMWRIDNEESDRAPIRVWVSLASHWSITPAQLISRGAAVAAFAMALSERRPVLVTPFWQLGASDGSTGTCVSWDLQTSPMVLSELMGCLANPNFCRWLGLHTQYMIEPSYRGQHFPGWDSNSFMRQVLGCEEEDIFLHRLDIGDTLLSDPIAWIKQQIARHVSEEVEA